MVAIEQVRSELTSLKRLGPGLVGVFVGGTSGMGEGTAREFVRHAIQPRIYLVGRSQEQADRIIAEFNSLNADSQTKFIKSDVSLIKNVDQVCEEIKQQEEKINLLFMSAGIFTTDGRNETSEGLDKKFALHYYSRLRFTQNLLPLLNRAADSTDSKYPPIARVFSVLGAGGEGPLNMSDLSLKNNFGLGACATHAITMNSLSLGLLASKNPKVTFFQTQPGAVKTNAGRDLPRLTKIAANALLVLMKPWVMSAEESGERHAWAATTDKFGKGGLVLIGPKGEPVGGEAARSKLLSDGADAKVWEHTEKVYNDISKDGKYAGD